MTNYTRGRSREYQAMHHLRREGWVCSRSAMSHGPVDLFAARAGCVLLVQVKSGSSRMKKLDIEILRRWADEFDARAEVWSYKTRGKLEKFIVRRESARELITSVPQIPL